jgi:RNA polymerase sigma factor (TIGR02999 family)
MARGSTDRTKKGSGFRHAGGEYLAAREPRRVQLASHAEPLARTGRPFLRVEAHRGGTIEETPSADGGEITRLVERWSDGDEAALTALIELVYDDLRQIAHRQLRDRSDHTINTTALVHEAYLRFARHQQGVWRSRAQFFAFASKAMRHILIDFARRRSTAKRGGARVQVPFDEAMAVVEAEAADLLALDDALNMLEHRSARMARVVECRYFGGLSIVETAEALDTSVRTVEREWTRARAHLHRVLAPGMPEKRGH